MEFTGELKAHVHNNYTRFSSRPLDIESKDDYWVLGNGLIVMETSILYFNSDALAPINTSSIPMFLRGNIANWMARDSEEWIDIFTRYNSGTHMAQWIVTDQNKERGDPWMMGLLDNTPSINHKLDITQLFEEQGYWAGYNVPYHEDIWHLHRYDLSEREQSYDLDERAVIIRDTFANLPSSMNQT